MEKIDQSPMPGDQLNETQRYILSVLKKVDAILRERKIPCYMQGGTMLGAIRHGGFIPWDDDVDLGIPRADYERFLKEVGPLLPENLELRTYWDETDHHYYFARIVDKRYRIKRMGSMEIRYENVWIDIFPLDGMPEKWLPRQFHKMRLLMHRMFYHLSCLEKVNVKRPGRPLVERIIIKVAAITRVGKWFRTRKELDTLDRLLKKYSPEETGWLINFVGQTSYKFNEMFRQSVYGGGKMYRFEDMELLGPVDYEAYLKSLYGDYMVPPREGDRNAHVSELVTEESEAGEQ